MKADNVPNGEQLPIAACKHPGYSEDIVFLISKWKFSPEELQKINETGCMYISIMPTQQPPIMPMVNNPFTEDQFKPINVHG